MRSPLGELAAVFLRLGATSFGGPAAHIAMMEDEVVRRRGWLTREAFLDLVGASQIIPGPNSTELAIHVGHQRAGWPGLLVAGACFILPAMAIVWTVAWGYVTFGALPQVAGILAGVKPVVLAVVAQALVGLGRTALTSAMTLAIGGLALVAVLLGVHEFVVLALAALLAWLDWRVTRGGNLWARDDAHRALVVAPAALEQAGGTLPPPGTTAGLAVTAALGGGGAAVTAAFSLGKLFLLFAKAGALLFGSGYVLVAFLRTDFVTRTGWLTEGQLLDAIAVGQFTPGPLFTTATFVGYLLGGHAGALVATLGIFLPAFVFVALTAPVLAALRTAPGVRAALSGLNVASLALMVAVTGPLAADALRVAWLAVPLFALAAFALLRHRVNSAWLVLGGAIIGWLVTRLGLVAAAGPV